VLDKGVWEDKYESENKGPCNPHNQIKLYLEGNSGRSHSGCLTELQFMWTACMQGWTGLNAGTQVTG
jgi:hypothetical protein